MAAAMWFILILGCGVVVAALWFYALLAVFTIGGTPTIAATTNGRSCLNAAAVVSVVSAVITVVLAIVLIRRKNRRAGAVVALCMAVCAPWAPVLVAVFGRLAGE